MSFTTINACVNDQHFVGRVTACVAKEQAAKGEPTIPELVVSEVRWAVASASDVEAAYASAVAAANPDPGGDESVITDGMILSNVQANWPAAP